MVDEPLPASSYPLYWSPRSSISLADFLARNKPSTVIDDGAKPWIYMSSGRGEKIDDKTEISGGKAQDEAMARLKETTEKIAAIQNDESIPTRANKSKGIRSKKDLREAAQASLKDDLKEIATKHNYRVGKWLFFPTPEGADFLFPKLCHSLLDGPLGMETTAHTVKIATGRPNEMDSTEDQGLGEGPKRVVCLYFEDAWDKHQAEKILRVLAEQHGEWPSSVKEVFPAIGVDPEVLFNDLADLYTTIGLDSKHPCGLRSTIWQPRELIAPKELEDMVANYRSEHGEGVDGKKVVKAKPAEVENDDDFDEEEVPSESKGGITAQDESEADEDVAPTSNKAEHKGGAVGSAGDRKSNKKRMGSATAAFEQATRGASDAGGLSGGMGTGGAKFKPKKKPRKDL